MTPNQNIKDSKAPTAPQGSAAPKACADPDAMTELTDAELVAVAGGSGGVTGSMPPPNPPVYHGGKPTGLPPG
jgi:hypothetical protein